MRLIAFLATLAAFSLPAYADDTFSCLNELTGPLVDVTGTEYVDNDWFDIQDGTRLDATGDIFTAQTLIPDTTKSKYPLDIRSLGARACWAGGVVEFTDDENATWAERKTYASAALSSQETEITIDGIRIHNAHDGIRPAWTRDGPATVSFTVRNSWLSYNRDDCIENDWHAGGLIDDSLFDGCYVFASATGGAVKSPNVVTIQNSLVYLQEQPGPNKWPDPTIMGHGELFKWSAFAPDVIIRDSIFLIEDYATTDWNPDGQPDHSANALAFKNIRECSNVTVVWDGPGDFPVQVPSCVTVTKDRAVWDSARDQWLVNHPNVARISGVDDPVVVVSDPNSTISAGDATYDVANVNDSDLPLVTFLSPANLVQRKSDQIIEVAATDNVGILRVEISIDGYPYAVLENNWSVNWSVPANPNGSYEISATAIDLSGNYSTQSIRVFSTR